MQPVWLDFLFHTHHMWGPFSFLFQDQSALVSTFSDFIKKMSKQSKACSSKGTVYPLPTFTSTYIACG